MTALAAMANAHDAALTADRGEIKYLVPLAQLPALTARLNAQLPAHRFRGEGANPLPGPLHFVTTIYFDTAGRAQYRAARSRGRQATKLRAKEYYDLHPSLAELATDLRQIVKYNPLVWLELKTRADDRTGKRRLGVPKRQLPELLAGQGAVNPGDEPTRVAILEHCRQLGEPVRADCLVNYRRLAWQHPAGNLRITVDVGLAFYQPPEDVWQRSFALTRGTLGTPRGRLDAAVLELKYRDVLPGWLLDDLDARSARRSQVSKFELASEAVHERS
jgi:hypothetical protein